MNTLSRLKQKGDEITGYFRNMTAGLLDRFECCAAGGAVVDYLNEGSVSHQGDIDVFLFDGERDFKRVSEYLQKMGYEAVYQAEHATLFKPAFSADAGAGGSPISLGGRRVFMPSLHIINTDIKHVRVYKDVRGVLETFDLGAAQVAVTADKTYATEAFLRAMDTKTISIDINNGAGAERALSTWLSTVSRIAKYCVNKDFQHVDRSLFDFLGKAAEYFDPDNDASESLAGSIYPQSDPAAPPFCQNPLLKLSEIGYRAGLWTGGGAKSPGWEKGVALPWRERYKEDSGFRQVVRRVQESFQKGVYPGFSAVVLAALVIRDGLKFPTELLERSHNGFFAEKFIRDLAWAIYAESGSAEKNFTSPYVLSKHFPFPDFSDPEGKGKEVNPPLPAPERSDPLFLCSKGMMSAALRSVEEKMQGRDAAAVKLALGEDKGRYGAGADVGLLGVPWGDLTRPPSNSRRSFTFAEAALLVLNEEVFCRLVDLGATGGRFVQRNMLHLENYLVRTAKLCGSERERGILQARLEKWGRMKRYAVDKGFPERDERYRKDRDKKIEAGEWAVVSDAVTETGTPGYEAEVLAVEIDFC